MNQKWDSIIASLFTVVIEHFCSQPSMFIRNCQFYLMVVFTDNLDQFFSSAEEKQSWFHDLQTAIDQSKRLAYDKLLQYGSLKSYSSSDEILDKFDSFPISPAHTGTSDGDTLRTKSPSERALMSSRSNTTLHVCWHRNTTISVRDLSRAFQVKKNSTI